MRGSLERASDEPSVDFCSLFMPRIQLVVPTFFARCTNEGDTLQANRA